MSKNVPFLYERYIRDLNAIRDKKCMIPRMAKAHLYLVYAEKRSPKKSILQKTDFLIEFSQYRVAISEFSFKLNFLLNTSILQYLGGFKGVPLEIHFFGLYNQLLLIMRFLTYSY